MRLTFAWLGGIATFFLCMAFFGWLGDAVGVPVSYDLGYTRIYSDRYDDYGTDREFTNAGLCAVFITWMLAIRVGMTINVRSFDAGVSSEGNLQFFCWLLGLAILSILMALLHITFRDADSRFSSIVNIALQMLITAGVWWAVKTFFYQRLQILKTKNGSPTSI